MKQKGTTLFVPFIFYLYWVSFIYTQNDWALGKASGPLATGIYI